MLCPFFAGSGITIHQAFEILAFQGEDQDIDNTCQFYPRPKKVRILLLVVVESERAEGQLIVGHRGNIPMQVVDSPWCPNSGVTSWNKQALCEVLSDRFEKNGKILFTPRASQYELMGNENRIEVEPIQPEIRRYSPESIPGKQWCPYTACEFSWKGNGPQLMAIEMQIKDENYKIIVSDKNEFTIDGSERVLDWIENIDIPMLAYEDSRSAEAWGRAISKVKESSVPPEWFEIVIAKQSLGGIPVRYSSKIAVIPRIYDENEESRRARRWADTFVTISPHFSLGLGFYTNRSVPTQPIARIGAC